MKLELTLPRPPSLNGLYANRKGGRYKVKRYRVWEDRAYQALMSQPIEWQTTTNPVMVIIFVNKKTADLQNMDKAVLDFLEGHVYENDSQVIELHLYHDAQCGDLMFITVEEM